MVFRCNYAALRFTTTASSTPGNNNIQANSRLICYVTDDAIQPSEIVNMIRKRRNGKLLNLDRMLLHSPSFAEGWNSLFGVIRSADHMSVNLKYRELAICSIAILNGAEYEFYQHEKPWREAGGTDQQVDAIRKIDTDHFRIHQCFDAIERDIIQLTIEMTKNIVVSADLLKRLKSTLSEKEVVELVGTIAGYNMVSRFLVALDISSDGER